MSKKSKKQPVQTFSSFVHAVVFDQKLAKEMIRCDPAWLTRTSASGETALAEVVIENYIEAAKFLIACGADANTQDHSAQTPLMYAAQLGYQAMVALLLEHDAEVNTQDEGGETALIKAAHSGYAEICDNLLRAGADRNLRNDMDETALDVALPRKRQQIISIFEKHGPGVP